MLLYHRTNEAAAILAEGFRDGRGRYMTAVEFSGVWLSDRPLDFNEGAAGDTLLTVEVPEQAIIDYEWAEDGKPYREFLVPAEVVNRYGRPQVVTE